MASISTRNEHPRGLVERLSHLGVELLIVAAGVLLALWAQAWFEGRVEAQAHRDTVAQMDAMISRVLAQTAARVSTDGCSRQRIAALDEALRSSAGQWRANPLPNLPVSSDVGHFPSVYLMDSDVLSVEVFATARANGTMLALPPDERRFYENVEREVHWLNDVWAASSDPSMQLSVLGVDGPLGETARDEMRQALAWLDNENRVTILRARSLARLARERGFQLTAADLAVYQQKLARDRGLFGECVVEVDPLQLTPVTRAN